jgi:small subunit ribosomal protein S18
VRKAAVPATVGGRKKRKMIVRRKRTLDPTVLVDYKNPDLLRRFITERGRIIPRRISGASQEQQRKITLAVKRARFLGLLPSAISHEVERGFAGEMQAAAQVYMTSARPRPPLRPGERSDRPMGDRPMGDRPERSDRPMGADRPARLMDGVTPAPLKKEE